jgi:sugar O-acyltransferase (sialic acid O-acetyltransferase NeuD family)
MEERQQIVVIGAGETAELAYEYFTHDSPHEVVAFSVEEKYLRQPELFGLPVVPFESVESAYPPDRFRAFVAVSYTQLNRARAKLFHAAKAKGYGLASYISSHAFVWRNVQIGENCFLLENNVVQYSVRIGDDVTLWSGNHIGHQSLIEDHCFISSHVVVSGYCTVGRSCFVGVNSSIAHNTAIAPDCVIGAGTVVVKGTEPGQVYVGNPARATGRSSYDSFQVPEELR